MSPASKPCVAALLVALTAFTPAQQVPAPKTPADVVAPADGIHMVSAR